MTEQAEERILGSIERGALAEGDAALMDETDLDVFTALTDLRAGLFAWYGFPAGAKILLVGDGYGAVAQGLWARGFALTVVVRSAMQEKIVRARHAAFLASAGGSAGPPAGTAAAFSADAASASVGDAAASAGSVSCLRVWRGEGAAALPSAADAAFVPREGFDAVLLVDTLSRVGEAERAAYLENVRALLAPQGRLLVAEDNRFGLRYLAGDVEPRAGASFAGVAGRSGLLSRQGLLDALCAGGFSRTKVYYPLPGWRLPQLIYSDGQLPGAEVVERLIPVYREKNALVAEEMGMLLEAIRNGAFPFCADAFLVECAPEGVPFDAAQYVALSTDRGREIAFATILRTDDTVRKQAIFREDFAHAREVYENGESLRAHGVPVIEQSYDGRGGISMPLVHAPTLSDHLRDIIKEKPEEVLRLLDTVWGYILRSSEEVPAGRNALLLRAPEADWGPILARAPLELVSMNAFYEAGRLLFFDQEYFRENYPAKYSLFRLLHYVQCFVPGAGEFFERHDVPGHFGMRELWDVLRDEEDNHFLRTVRRHDVYAHLLARSRVDMGRVFQNGSLLQQLADYREQALFAGAQGRRLVLFGTGAYFRRYMALFGATHRPDFAVDSDSAKWGTEVSGVPVRAPSALRAGGCHVIVCVKAAAEILAELAKLGVVDARVFRG